MLNFEQIRNNKEIKIYIEQGDAVLAALGFTEHSYAHATKVALLAQNLLSDLGFDDKTCTLGAISGYIHDIGNAINRVGHAQSGALLAFSLLRDLDIDPKDIAVIVSAVGNHDELASSPPDEVAAALILADKSDVRRSRVRNRDITTLDIHDRVNYAAEKSDLVLFKVKKIISLNITIDTSISAVMDYFEIFLSRMVLCRKAAKVLGLDFELMINGNKML